MVFEINFSLHAERHLENAIAWYKQISLPLASRFYKEFFSLIALLESKPFFQKKYDEVRTCKLESFPYLVHEEMKVVVIIAVAFGKQGRTSFRNITQD